ncbi:MAG: steroid 3-ketoacyl-CoA thiolase [Alphaproteobacteria bacterium]|nr:MAG: steroid 3-ketoacyl-CoA thiolase [Alphaproteobacteria bacterium]
MRHAVIVDGVRSPFGKGRAGGALHGLHPVDLLARCLEALASRTGIDSAIIEDVITGCVIQAGEQAGNIGRQAVLAAGWPEHIPAVSLDRKCGSAQQAIDFAACGIIAGAYDVVVAAGVEMMSTVPAKANRLGRDNLGVGFATRYPEGLVHQGVSAELIAARGGIGRAQMDEFALRSHQLAAAGPAPGLVPVQVGDRLVTHDEGVRADSTLERLAALPPAFHTPAMADRFPQIDWQVTAGNSSQVSDGAFAMLLMEEARARALGLRPRARVTHFAVAGDDPLYMLTAIVPATGKLLARTGLGIADIDVFEVNEAFASVVLDWLAATGADPARVNVHGGAIATGHPVGASGGRLFLNCLAALEATGGRHGLVTMCESGGMANATLITRCED